MKSKTASFTPQRRAYSQSELQEAGNYLNSHYVGKELPTIRTDLLNAMEKDQSNLNRLLQATIDVANQAFLSPAEEAPDYAITGQNNMLNYSREGNLENLRALFDAFAKKQEILNLLDHSLAAEGIQIFIGQESGYKAFGECSIVTASYSVDGQLVGSLGVIGPQRMPYDRVISAVDVTSKLLSAALNQS